MTINPSFFYKHNITDTSAIWNILSSRLLFTRAKCAGVFFYCTKFVIYECLNKKRNIIKEKDLKLQTRLREAIEENSFQSFSLDIEDLQQVEFLENRKRLGKGELSSIAFAIKTKQAFLNDDKKARRLAESVLNSSFVQTTPHLLSWLIFSGQLSDFEKGTVISEHMDSGCNMAEHLENAYREACRCRLLQKRALFTR